MIDGPGREPNYFWTKTWGPPGDPSQSMLAFNLEGNRRDALEVKGLQPGDIVVYLTTDGVEPLKSFKGLVSGAVEVEGTETTAEESGTTIHARDVDFNGPGRTNYRWPWGITITRSWRLISTLRNDQLVPGHGDKGIAGATQIRPMSEESARLFRSMKVEEITAAGALEPEIFGPSLRRPWRQKAGERAGGIVDPGTFLYVAQIVDSHGLTFKIGSGKPEERLAAMNLYRRGSQGEMLWSLVKHLVEEFRTVDAARDAEDYILKHALVAGHRSKDHNEFLKGVSMPLLEKLFTEAVEVGRARDAQQAAAE